MISSERKMCARLENLTNIFETDLDRNLNTIWGIAVNSSTSIYPCMIDRLWQLKTISFRFGYLPLTLNPYFIAPPTSNLQPKVLRRSFHFAQLHFRPLASARAYLLPRLFFFFFGRALVSSPYIYPFYSSTSSNSRLRSMFKKLSRGR